MVPNCAKHITAQHPIASNWYQKRHRGRQRDKQIKAKLDDTPPVDRDRIRSEWMQMKRTRAHTDSASGQGPVEQ